jgi:pilus assembly protein CpaC
MKMRKTVLITVLIIISVAVLHFNNYAADSESPQLKLYMGEVKILKVDVPSRIVIGNPNIADVTEVTKNAITVTPKSQGETTLVIWDNSGEHPYQIVIYAENMEQLKQNVDTLLKTLDFSDVYSRISEEESKVFLLGSVKTPGEREKLNLALAPFKNKIVDFVDVKEEEAVVEIATEVLELSQDATNTLGLTWPGSINLTEVGSAGISSAGAKWSTLFKILNVERGTYSSTDGTTTADPFTFRLDALVQQGKARILSSPRLACQSGKEAELLVGGEKPVFTTTYVASTGGTAGQSTGVDYKEFGIKLKIKPTVTKENRIKLAVNLEVSEVGTVEFIGSTGDRTAQAYPLTKRSASTELFLDDGQTLAIGGLKKQKSSEDIRKTPWLGDIPILGLLFRKKTSTIGGGTGERGDMQLYITLTPRIVKETKEKKEEPVSQVLHAQQIKEITKTPSLKAKAKVPDPRVEYAGLVQKRILERLTYPLVAKQAGLEGTVKLRLHISYSGKLTQVMIKKSSGHDILDNQAVAVAKEIDSFPPFPPTIEQKELWIEIPIVFQLN